MSGNRVWTEWSKALTARARAVFCQSSVAHWRLGRTVPQGPPVADGSALPAHHKR
jgi:hypothetical protein